MIEIQEISAKGIPVLDTFTLPLNRYPCVVIRGKNLNKKHASTKNISNGSGKTLSVSPLSTILYDSTPSSLKKKGTKDLLRHKNSEISVTFNNGRQRCIQQVLGSSVKYTISTDGEPRHYREAREARAKIAKLFPLTEDQFYSQVYIDGRDKTILQKGTSAQRFAYLESIFRLNEYDRIGAFISKDYNRIKAYIQELNILVEEKRTRKQDLPIFDLAKMKIRQTKIEDEIKKINQRVEQYIEVLNQAKSYLGIVEELTSKKPPKELKKLWEEAQNELVDLTALYKKSVRFYETLESQQAIAQQRQKLRDKIEGIEGDPDFLEGMIKTYGSRQDLQMHLAVEVEQALALRENRRDLKEKIKNLPFQTIPDRYQAYSLNQLQSMLDKTSFQKSEKQEARKRLQDFIDHEHKSPDCPVCQRGFSKKTAIVVRQSLDVVLSKLERRETSLKTVVKLKKTFDQLKDIGPDNLDTLEARYEKEAQRLESLQLRIKSLQKKQNYIEILRGLPKVTLTEDKTIPKPFVYEDTIADLDKRISALESNINVYKRIKRLGFNYDSVEEAKESYNKAKEKIERYRPLLQDLQAQLNALIAKGSAFETVQTDLDRLVKKINDLKIETQDFQVLEAMRKAFGNKGLRKIKTRYYVQQLQNSFNKYAHLIFGEPIKFLFQLTDTKFDILCEINGGITDARKLSGAESSSFTLLLILCILPFIPANYRCNLLLLDELESGFDQYSQELFITRFLPILNQLIPNIVIITPRSEKEFYVPNAVTYLVTKKGHKATINKLETREIGP